MTKNKQKIIQSEKESLPPQKKKKKRKKETEKKKMLTELQRLWTNTKESDIHRLGIPKGENKENEAQEILEEKVRKNFPNLWKYINS